MIGQYSTMKDLDDEIDSLKGEKKSLEDQLGKVKEEKITLGSINSMCTKLNQELGYGVPDITSVYGAAAKFGQPNRILQAIMKYGELEAIQREVDGWKRVISQDKTQVGLLNKEIQELEAKRDLTMTQIKDGASGLQSQQDQALKFGEELKMARMYLAITKYPLELGRESVEYCTAILRSLAQMVRDAKLNRSYLIKDISDKNALPKYGSFVPYLNVELLDLLNWTERAIKESFMRAMLDSQGGKA
jgi:septal ring factor EnvC (AmiA/AmiB activator)